eukprot:Seg1889.4 transcript_id=Seg1889.4/GoldUCD/mRNA.D3Y31 product="Ubiquitin carboxyl-terminal hydrolase 48" protein_id=Seg1889.4/GoldUCD/D3Y31
MAPKKASAATAKSNVYPPGWEWVQNIKEPLKVKSINESFLQQSYRFDAPQCEKGACRTNCKKNPNCHNCLGEKFWQGEIKDNFWIDVEDPEEQRKPEGSHVGLKNLGATCYVNTFLQLWFHNHDFRSAIFKWIPSGGYHCSRDEADTQEGPGKDDASANKMDTDTAEYQIPTLTSPAAPKFGDSVPDNICGNLQLLFSLMKHSEKKFVDPSPFVQSLGLQTDEQQDAQEFSKLFMSLLESTLANQHDSVKDLVQDQYGGKYAYETRCNACGKYSRTESQFYELDLNIQGHLLLKECIKEFLKEEKLENDNKYFCTNCQVKQDATRKIVLQSLPPVLNLQLLRFVFDRNTGLKKKCNSMLRFPEQLDMNEFMQFEDPSQGIYELTAVLIHCGLSAYSGHYVAHILDKKDDAWYRFNDEVVEKMTGRKLQLGTEDDPEDPGKLSKKSKVPKGYHNSKNAYMLVYSRKGDETKEFADIRPPEVIQEYVAMDNSLFEAWMLEAKTVVEAKVGEGRFKHQETLDIYNNIQSTSNERYEWVLTDWLRKWLNAKQVEVPPIDNSILMCKHGSLDPGKIHLSKRISEYSGDKLFRQYGGIPRLKSDAFCLNCVFNRAVRIQFDARMEEDKKIISAANKVSFSCKDGFWVGRSSLKQWKNLAIQAQHFENSEENTETSQESRQSSPQSDIKEAIVNGDDINRNDSGHSRDQKCEDSRTEIDRDSRADIEMANENVQAIKRKCAENGDSKEAKMSKCENTEVSVQIVNGDVQEENDIDEIKREKLEKDCQVKQKMFNDDIICSEHGNLSLDESKRKLISTEVWNCLRYYFKDCPEFDSTVDPCVLCVEQSAKKKARKDAVKILANDMRCTLTDLYQDIKRPQLSREVPFEVYVVCKYTLEDWRHFLRAPRLPAYDSIENAELICEHQKSIYSADDFFDSGADPEYCLVTADEWLMLSGFLPCDQEIKLTNQVTKNGDTRNTVTISPECCLDCRMKRVQEEQEMKTEFFYSPIYVRKVTTEGEAEEAPEEITLPNVAELEAPTKTNGKKSSKKYKLFQQSEGQRRSTRHRTQRGEYMFKMDSSQTLKDVKVQLIGTFSVLPCDQHLSLQDGTPLVEDSKTLADLGIRPGSVLLLKVDEPNEEAPAVEIKDSNGDRIKEEGFKGTGLCWNFQNE